MYHKHSNFLLTKAAFRIYKGCMAGVAQSVRAPGCGSGGRRFNSGHSPHFLMVVFLLLINFSVLASSEKPLPSQPLSSPVDSIIPEKIPFKKQTEKPTLTIIVDCFGAREDFSKTILSSLPSKTILSIASHMPLNMEYIKKAIEFGFKIAISLDYVTMAQWQILQKTIVQLNAEIKKFSEKSAICGVIIWRVAAEEDFTKIMNTMKKWLTMNNMWLFYANTNNILPTPNLAPGIIIPDGFITPTNSAQHMEEITSFVLNQAQYNEKGIMLIKPAKQHLQKLSDWLQQHLHEMTLENWEHQK